MWHDFLFYWPDQFESLVLLDLCLFDRVAILLRSQRFLDAQNLLLASDTNNNPDDSEAFRILLCFIYFNSNLNSASKLIEELLSTASKYRYLVYFLKVQLSLKQLTFSDLPASDSNFWGILPNWQPLVVSHAAISLIRGDLTNCESLLNSICEPHSLEAIRLQAALYLKKRSFQAAVDSLSIAVQRFPQHIELHAQYINTLLEARSQTQTIPALRQALTLHGEHPRLLASVCTVKLLQRQPSLARRAAFVQRLWPDVAIQDNGRLSNVLVTYEQTGHSDWLAYLSASALDVASSQLSIQENLCLQFASVESVLSAKQLQKVVDIYQRNPIATSWQQPINKPPVSSPLRIGWISGDICQHPVARFLLGFFEAGSLQSSHQHILVNLKDHASESYLDRFCSYPNLMHLNASFPDASQQVRVIRDAHLDVAIDLSGWTGGHFMRGFMARLAPLQVNYLGYFASTGLPTMDAWIGDDGLFPTPMQEWHSETIHRLPRCFIAWQPSQHLDEAHEPVTHSPTGGIRFGCFNHNRKLSDAVLRLWGELLRSVPDSNLVLKANAASDPHTQLLLVRRMRRAGLDPERVIWLPLAPSHREHLQQYAQVDVALDSFPNGGCTTTCEALWMGVPVITLTGTHYVSRMSTAVLRGAGLPHLCAKTPQQYLDLAREQAMGLSELRSNRDRWRNYVTKNPLGDAADLIKHLEHAFVMLHIRALAQ